MGISGLSKTRTPYGEFAEEFARAIVGGNFALAESMLSPSAVETSFDLEQSYCRMVSYAEEPPRSVKLLGVMDDWPDKLDGDVGWAYVAIVGDGWSEAVTVVVAVERSQFGIREIEWGRP